MSSSSPLAHDVARGTSSLSPSTAQTYALLAE